MQGETVKKKKQMYYLSVTNEMQLLEISVINTAVHVSGPIIRSLRTVSAAYCSGMQ